MNQKLLKKLPRYCAIALICAMTAAVPAWAFTSADSKISAVGSGNITGKGVVAGVLTIPILSEIKQL